MAGPNKQRLKNRHGPKSGAFSPGLIIAQTADALGTFLGAGVGLAYDTATKGGKRADKLLAKRVARSAKRGKKRRGAGPDQF